MCSTLRLCEPRFASHLIGIASAGFYPSVGFADTSPASMLLYKQMKHFNIYLTLAYQCFDCMRFISDGKTMAVRAARERIRQPY